MKEPLTGWRECHEVDTKNTRYARCTNAYADRLGLLRAALLYFLRVRNCLNDRIHPWRSCTRYILSEKRDHPASDCFPRQSDGIAKGGNMAAGKDAGFQKRDTCSGKLM